MKQNKKQQKRFFTFGIIFWIGFILLMCVLFYMNRKSISKTINQINGAEEPAKVAISKQDIKNEIENKEKQSPPKKDEDVKKETELEEADTEDENNDIEEIDETPPEGGKDTDESDTNVATINEPETAENEKSAEENVQVVDVYFVSISNSGTVTREKCTRTLEKSPSPLTDSINALLKGTTKEEAKKGIRSFIPADTKLISASIKEGVATINLSEDFQFNRYGVEGYNIQLQQIVFTACAFKNVQSVQFLIEGQKRDFLGSEGGWIAGLLDVNSF